MSGTLMAQDGYTTHAVANCHLVYDRFWPIRYREAVWTLQLPERHICYL